MWHVYSVFRGPDEHLYVSECTDVLWSVISDDHYVLLTVHRSISLDNDQLDAHLLYFTIRPLQSSTCFEHYMLIIRRLNCIDAASDIVLSVSDRQVHRLRENCSAVLSQPVQLTVTD